MKSFCIKTNNKNIISSLLKDFNKINLNDVYFINKKFKNYENVIIHYIGDNLSSFLTILSDILTNCILYYYESNLIKRNINYNYFYFDNYEKKIIENFCYQTIEDNNNQKYIYRKKEIWISVLDYIKNNKTMILDGFVNFRLQNYNYTLDEIIDLSVKQYVIEKEYSELINLLQSYINTKEPNCSTLHLIYINGESIILDDEKNIVNLEDEIFNSKYLSDISFSSNDYALNALLTFLPKKIYLHLIGCEDDFINTLKLIFTNRICICKNCNICKTYKLLLSKKNL